MGLSPGGIGLSVSVWVVVEFDGRWRAGAEFGAGEDGFDGFGFGRLRWRAGFGRCGW